MNPSAMGASQIQGSSIQNANEQSNRENAKARRRENRIKYLERNARLSSFKDNDR